MLSLTQKQMIEKFFSKIRRNRNDGLSGWVPDKVHSVSNHLAFMFNYSVILSHEFPSGNISFLAMKSFDYLTLCKKSCVHIYSKVMRFIYDKADCHLGRKSNENS